MASFGIDFGTTNTSVVECLITEHGMTRTPYGENNQPFPSLVALHPEKPPMFGWDVKKRRSQLIVDGYHIISSFKSILGSDQSIAVGDKKYSPLDVTALFLSFVKNRVETMAERSLDEAVIAIPVDFKPEQRRNLREAAKKQEFVLSLLSVNLPLPTSIAERIWLEPAMLQCSTGVAEH